MGCAGGDGVGHGLFPVKLMYDSGHVSPQSDGSRQAMYESVWKEGAAATRLNCGRMCLPVTKAPPSSLTILGPHPPSSVANTLTILRRPEHSPGARKSRSRWPVLRKPTLYAIEMQVDDSCGGPEMNEDGGILDSSACMDYRCTCGRNGTSQKQ